MIAKKQSTTKQALPDGIKRSDESYNWKTERVLEQFELWHVTSFGWVIPTLHIGRGAPGMAPRTYAIRLSDGQTCRVGGGPHVTEQLRIYVTPKNEERLKKFVEMKEQGAGKAGVVRDRISSRRAQGQEERALGKSYWRWKV